VVVNVALEPGVHAASGPADGPERGQMNVIEAATGGWFHTGAISSRRLSTCSASAPWLARESRPASQAGGSASKAVAHFPDHFAETRQRFRPANVRTPGRA
jgi:hypothetical protein